MKLNNARRTATVMTLCGLATIATVGPLADVASAATSPTISYDGNMLTGSGFTPTSKVLVRVMEGSTLFASTTVLTTAPRLVCAPPVPGEPRDCWEAGGGAIGTYPPSPEGYLGCSAIVSGTVSATDLKTGSVASIPYTWVGMC